MEWAVRLEPEAGRGREEESNENAENVTNVRARKPGCMRSKSGIDNRDESLTLDSDPCRSPARSARALLRLRRELLRLRLRSVSLMTLSASLHACLPMDFALRVVYGHPGVGQVS